MVAFSYLYISNPSFIKELAESLGTLLSIIGIISFVFLGSVIYLVYRALLYNMLILHIQDFFRRKPGNYRTYLKQHYGIGTHEAQQLWLQIKGKYFKDCYSQPMKEIASGIHLIYLAGFIAIPFAFWNLTYSSFTLKWPFLVIALIFLLGAFFLDRSYEDIEVRFLYSLDDTERNDLHLFVTRILKNVQQASSTEKGT